MPDHDYDYPVQLSRHAEPDEQPTTHPLASAMSSLAAQIEDLAAALDHLQERLHNVLVPQQAIPHNGRAEDTVKPSDAAPLTMETLGMRARVSGLIGFVRALDARIEV